MKIGLLLIVPALVLAQAPIHKDQPGAAPVNQGGASEDPLITRARLAVLHFIRSLPDFSCDESVQRWESATVNPDWKLQDRIAVELLFLHGKEDYRNVRINGKPIKKGALGDSGQWSTGEFGSLLADVFSPSTHAAFHFAREAAAGGRASRVYDFSVTQANSHWTMRMSYAFRPPYHGSAWIDAQSGQVLRVELRSRAFPPDYEVNRVEEEVDYEWVTIAGTKYLLPVRSSNLSCSRHSLLCDRNDVEFKSYRKFAVESQILPTGDEVTPPATAIEKPK
ncbi:MAG: hypothetical protein ACLQBJ_20265 [Bryobacteraceae bacterium]